MNLTRRSVLSSMLVLAGCAHSNAAGSPCPSTAPPETTAPPTSEMIPMTPDVMRAFRPLPSPWRDLDPSSIVLPWHRAVMGEPKQAMVTWLPVTPHGEGDPGRTPCDAYRVGFGELEVLYANDAPDITRASCLVIGANVTPAAAAKAESMLEPPRALPNGWSECVSRKDPSLSLFTQPSRPWLCASGAAVREQLRALLSRDPQLPVLVGLPRDVLHATFNVGDATAPGTAQWGFTLMQLDRDARQHMAEVSCSRQLPRGFQLFVQNRTHYGSAAAAQAAFFKVGPPSEQTLLGPDTFDRDVVRVR